MSETQRDAGLEAHFESMRNLWDNTDFQVLLSELSDQSKSINEVTNVVPSLRFNLGEETAFRKGQMDVINTLLNLSANMDILETDYNKSLEPQEDLENEIVY